MTAMSQILRRLRMRRIPAMPPAPVAEKRPVRFEWATPLWFDEAKEVERAEDESGRALHGG